MSVTAISNKWLNRLYKSIAILLVLFAVLISAFRLLLPYAQHYTTDLQDYINDTYQTNIEIGSLSMDWQKVGPVLVANNVSLVNTDAVEVFIGNLDIKLNFWKSLRYQQLITRGFTLDGAKVYINQETLTENTINQQDSNIFENLSDLFLVHAKRFSLTNSQVIIERESGKNHFSIARLKWLNDGDRHKAIGTVGVNSFFGNTVELKLDLTGEEFTDV